MATIDPSRPGDFGDSYLAPGETLQSVNDKISDIVLRQPNKRGWSLGFALAFVGLNIFLLAVVNILFRGIGVWGLNSPNMWAWDITNFVWWIGIGHAGTLISAILLLLKQEWRTSINRFAEAMTLFAVSCAGLYPILHLGRPWVFYWLMPYPNTMGLWPQFRSPLVWDVFAVSTYATVSMLFWYVGLLPDLALLRDRAKNKFARMAYGIFALGWRGSSRHWSRYMMAYLLLAGLSTPLVVSVHSVVSFDFSVGQIPGWHTTIFPPYFVAGAIYSGFAMVLTLMIPVRYVYGLHGYITDKHLDVMAKVMLATGLIVAYGYLMEDFVAWYGENEYEIATMLRNRPFGPYRFYYWALIACNVIIPGTLLWFPWVRRNVYILWVLSIIINAGMWLERYVIIVLSLSQDFVPAAWEGFSPTIWDVATYVGTLGLFFSLLFLFLRALPLISIAEMREMVHHNSHTAGPGHGHATDQKTGHEPA
jgi:molybdopterin-containing oxidoreductase family membrane subunit